MNFRVQGAIRSYAVGLASGDRLVLYKNSNGYREIIELDYAWECGREYTFRVEVKGPRMRVYDRNRILFDFLTTPALNIGAMPYPDYLSQPPSVYLLNVFFFQLTHAFFSFIVRSKFKQFFRCIQRYVLKSHNSFIPCFSYSFKHTSVIYLPMASSRINGCIKTEYSPNIIFKISYQFAFSFLFQQFFPSHTSTSSRTQRRQLQIVWSS